MQSNGNHDKWRLSSESHFSSLDWFVIRTFDIFHPAMKSHWQNKIFQDFTACHRRRLGASIYFLVGCFNFYFYAAELWAHKTRVLTKYHQLNNVWKKIFQNKMWNNRAYCVQDNKSLYFSYLKCPQILKILLGKTFNEVFNRFSCSYQSPGVERALRKIKKMIVNHIS